MVDVDVCMSKEELAWAVGKWFRVISTIILFKKYSKTTKELKGNSHLKQYCICCYVALSSVFCLFQGIVYCDLSRLLNWVYFRYILKL